MNLYFSYAKISDERPFICRLQKLRMEKGVRLNKIIIIGGGASGMMAAISAARQGADVTILEHMDRIGKKILSTGNGKCNYTNRKQGLRFYRGENPAFVLPALEQFGFEATIAFFKGLGIVPKERDGYFYPASGQASSVLDVLRMELRRLNVKVQTNCSVSSVRTSGKRFEIKAGRELFLADKCIFACGGKAFPKSGSDGSAFCHIQKLGHTFVDVVPALVQMKAKQSFFKSLAGIRTDAVIRLFVDRTEVSKDRGELQFTKEGISGIPAFQVSRYAARAFAKKKKVRASLDLAPDFTKEELKRELEERFFRQDQKTAEEALIGFFPKKLIPILLKENGISLHEASAVVSADKAEGLSRYLKHMPLDLTETEGFDKAQACAGGVSTAEIHADTMESDVLSGIYFAGEVIDVDGMCGGYNLQWAWSSGYAAGTHAARK